MPPRRHPRSWLAVRLRSAAGAVQRLAGRVEPAGHPPPPSETPTATPRRFGEPPQHWLDLVAAHAPGLLHDLDLDPSPAGTAEAGARDGGRDESADRVDADGANPVGSARLGRFDNAPDVGRPVRESGAGGRGPGASGDRGPTRSRAESRSGRLGRPSRAGERPDGTGIDAAGPPGGGVPSSSSDGTTPSAGSTWPDTSTPPAGPTWPAGPGAAAPPVRRAARSDTTARGDTAALDASGLPRSDGSRQPVRSMVFEPHTSPSGRAHRTEADAIRTTPHPPRDAQWLGEVDHGPGDSPGSSAVRPTADRLSGGRDGFRGDSDGSADDPPRPRAGQRGYPVGRRDSTARASQVDAAAGAASYGRPAGPTAGEFDASWTGTTTSARNTSTSARGDLARVADGGPWLALPGEPAQPGRPDAVRGTGTGSAGGGRVPGLDGPPLEVAVRVVDPWPALPDDTALWSVAGAALDTAQLTRLDREQAGD
ncbi:hypothetical protein ACIBD9_22045 [Micromonospora sp. NPDC050784]|uniref:hypothetical protein n=1 Tax=Micromonospora sp. NPDC050784 TaxID=3364281 RepID=UPI0037928028